MVSSGQRLRIQKIELPELKKGERKYSPEEAEKGWKNFFEKVRILLCLSLVTPERPLRLTLAYPRSSPRCTPTRSPSRARVAAPTKLMPRLRPDGSVMPSAVSRGCAEWRKERSKPASLTAAPAAGGRGAEALPAGLRAVGGARGDHAETLSHLDLVLHVE